MKHSRGPFSFLDEVHFKSIWAGRAASDRWAAAFEAKSLEGMDDVDLAVAVFDKTCQL